jgi:hypothetical protein
MVPVSPVALALTRYRTMLHALRTIEELAYRHLESIREDDNARELRGKHKRYGGSRVAVADEDYGVASGGAFNASDGANVAYGITKADVAAFVAHLSKIGFRISAGEAEAMLFEATTKPKKRLGMTIEEKREKARLKKARQRAAAREAMRCIICCSRCVAFDDQGNPRSTCPECSQARS